MMGAAAAIDVACSGLNNDASASTAEKATMN
jgi:hypothetical protein